MVSTAGLTTDRRSLPDCQAAVSNRLGKAAARRRLKLERGRGGEREQTAGACRTAVSNRLGKAAARRRLELGRGGERGGADDSPPERAGLHIS